MTTNFNKLTDIILEKKKKKKKKKSRKRRNTGIGGFWGYGLGHHDHGGSDGGDGGGDGGM
jgi:hypothetical protein